MRTERLARGETGTRRLGRPVQKSDLEFDLALGDRIDFMNPQHWDRLAAPASILLFRDYLSLVEDHGPRGVRARYGMLYHKDEPVAALVARLVKMPEERPADSVPPRRASLYRAARRDTAFAIESAPTPAPRRAVICGDLHVGGFHGITTRGDRALSDLWPGITALLQRIHLQEGMNRERDFILIKDIPATVASGARQLRHAQFRKVDASPGMVLNLSPRWRNYDDYLAQLNVRYRLSAVRSMRDLVRQGFESAELHELDHAAGRLHELLLQVQRGVGAGRFTWDREFLPGLARMLGPERFRCATLERDGEIAGFAFTAKDRDTALCIATGWDTERCAEQPMLSALLHGVVRDALAMGCSRVYFGRSALRAKAQLGAHPEQAEVWVRHAQPELDVSLLPLIDTISHAPRGGQGAPLPL